MSFADTIVIALALFLLAFLGLIGYILQDAIMTSFDGAVGVPVDLHQNMLDGFLVFDEIVAIGLALLVIASVLLAGFARSHPALAVVAVIMQLFFIIFGYFIQLLYVAFTEQPEISAIVHLFPISNIILTIFAPIMFIITLVILIVLYIRPQAQGNIGGY
jgi:hypothetical protein